MSDLEDFSEAVIKNDLNLVQKSFKTEYLYQFNKNGFTGFIQACQLGYTELVKFFLHKEADVDLATSNGWNGLHWAAGSGHLDTVLLLLDNGAGKESETNKKFRPLHCASLGDYDRVVRALLARGCDYNARNKDNKTPLDIANDMKNDKSISLLNKWINYDKIFNIVRQNRLDEFIEAFLTERVTVKERSSGMTVLDVAVESKSYSCLEKVLLHDLDENVVVTSLHFTLHKLKLSADSFRAQYRLYRSIILDLKDQFDDLALVHIINSPWVLTQESFLHICVHFNRKDMVVSTMQMLLNNNEPVIRTLTTALELATKKGLIKIVKIITQRKKLLESRERASFNRLFLAIQDNRVDVVKHILVNRLIDPESSDRVLGPPLCFALLLGYSECVQLLLDHGVNVNVRNQYSQTPLHIAVVSGMAQLGAVFIDKVKDVDQRDNLAYTPLHHGAINKDDELCSLLLKKGANLFNNLKIPRGEYADDRLTSPIFPLLNIENPVTLCLKLHRYILPSLMDKIDNGNVNSLLEDGSSLLHLSARLLSTDTCTKLIDKGANVNAPNNVGNIPIHSLFLESFEDSWKKEDFLDTLRVFVNNGADINLLNNGGVSSFRCAFDTGAKNIVSVILSRCERLDATMEDFIIVYNKQWLDVLNRMLFLQKDEFKGHLIIHSLEKGKEELMDFILTTTTEDLKSSIIEDCIYHCCSIDNEAMFKKLSNRIIMKPKLFPSGETLLTRLIIENNVKYSLRLAKSEMGEKYHDTPNGTGHTPLYLSAKMGSLKLCEYLVLESPNMEYKDADEETAMEKLLKSVANTADEDILRKVEKIVKTMIRSGMDIYRENKKNERAIQHCKNDNLRKKLEAYAAKNVSQQPRREVYADEERNICDICLDRNIDCQFGCGHPICRLCADQVLICPKCRAPKTQIFPLYLP